ncbi:MAG: hypothetical protein K9H14_00575 [Actinomycetia bacterium]|nr:hypothetical protein [Actinomycetes bacterium]
MRYKKAVTSELKKRYNKSTKKQKGAILDEFTAITGYNRSYASWILKAKKQKIIGYMTSKGKKIKFVVGEKKKRNKPRIYGHDVCLALKRIWVVFDFICSKRLAPFMAEAVEKLEKHKEINISYPLTILISYLIFYPVFGGNYNL